MADLAGTNTPIKTEATRFRSSVSESLVQLMGGDINYLLASILPVGSVVSSMLTEAQYQDQASEDWVLADGRNVAGSTYALVTGFSTIPDLRGVFIRGKNHARSTSTGHPDGDKTLGTYDADQVGPHTHATNATSIQQTGGPIVKDDGSEYAIPGATIYASSGAETRPRSVALNVFIRIN